MHGLAFGVHLPVLGKLPVERAAQAFEQSWRRLLPARRGNERLCDREPRRLQDLGSLAVADVDGDGLEVHRPLVRTAHQAHREVRPDVLAVLTCVALLEPASFVFPREHALHRLLQRGNVIGVCDVEQRERPQLVVAVTDQVAKRGVDRCDVSVQRGERHTGLGLVKQGSESRLHIPLRLFGA